MFGKYQAVFRSRWRAVLWSLGVLLTAYCTVPSADQGSEEDSLVAVAALAGKHGAGSQEKPDEPHHTNPWALDKGAAQ